MAHHDLSGCLAAILRFFWRRIHYVYVFWLSLSVSEAAEFRFTSRFLIDAILVDSGLRDYEINLDRRFSAEIRVLTGFHAYPENRFICKTGTEQHTTGPADFLRPRADLRRMCGAEHVEGLPQLAVSWGQLAVDLLHVSAAAPVAAAAPSYATAHVAAAACVAAAAPLGPRTDRAEGGRPGPCTISNKKISLDGSVSSASHPTRLATTLPMVQSVSVAGHFLLKTGLSALQPP
jgi:hypothetical protein